MIIINIMWHNVKKTPFSYINDEINLKSLVIHAFWLAVMGGMNFIGLINYKDIIRTLSILHITVAIAPLPHEKEQAKFSSTIM